MRSRLPCSGQAPRISAILCKSCVIGQFRDGLPDRLAGRRATPAVDPQETGFGVSDAEAMQPRAHRQLEAEERPEVAERPAVVETEKEGLVEPRARHERRQARP